MAKDKVTVDDQSGVRLTRHPRARRHIALAKGWGGLVAFAAVVFLSHRAGVPTTDAVLRGILGGMVGYVLGWMLAVVVWRQLALAEIERGRQSLLAELSRQEALARAAAQAGDGGRPPELAPQS
jgi:uncharacterized membrane protein YccC